MEQTLVVKGNIYSVIKDENEIPARVSRLKNNLTSLGRWLFGAWMAKHANYYISGADFAGYVSGIILGIDEDNPGDVWVIIPQISGVALTGYLTSKLITSSVGPYNAGVYSSWPGYASSYVLGTLWDGSDIGSVTDTAAWMGVRKAPDSSDPTTSGAAHLNITRVSGGVVVTIKGYYSFSALANSSYLILAVDGRIVPVSSINEQQGQIPTNLLGTGRVSCAIFSRTFSASFTNGQSIRVTWQVNISGS
jgi:hypothetical protein